VLTLLLPMRHVDLSQSKHIKSAEAGVFAPAQVLMVHMRQAGKRVQESRKAGRPRALQQRRAWSPQRRRARVVQTAGASRMQGAAGGTETVRRLQGRIVSWLRGAEHLAGRQSMFWKAAGAREELDVRVTGESKKAGMTLWDDAV